jgi:hypothetical protein
MKKLYFILLTSLFLAACSKENNENTIQITGQFVDNDIECNSFSIESGCIKFVSFINSTELYLLYEGDIMLTGNYVINGKIISTENINYYPGEISFKIIDNKTLERIEDGAIFSKENN